MNRDPRLRTVSDEPFNAETSLADHVDAITPNALFYVRNHFPVPDIDPEHWKLAVTGEVNSPLELSYDELRALPAHALPATLECAGNGRLGLQPAARGEPWGWAAVSTARWTGTPLRGVLDMAGLKPDACEILTVGADQGYVPDAGATIPFARSLPLAAALSPDTLLAYEMNGETLPPDHGYPVRLIVPGWYGVASVKWLARIEAISSPFRGFYQADRYVMRLPDQTDLQATPLTDMRVRSLIVEPAAGSEVPAGTVRVVGLAWSGSAPIDRVEISTGEDEGWQSAQLVGETERYSWCRWQCDWSAHETGTVVLRSRAFDSAGHTQPDEPEWNDLGYCNNAVQTVTIRVV